MKAITSTRLLYLLSVLSITINCKKSDQELNDYEKTGQEDIWHLGSDFQLANNVIDVADQVRSYKINHPRASEYELNSFVESLLRNIQIQDGEYGRGAYTDMDSYLNDKLNNEEKSLYRSNKARALICMADAKLAIKFAERNYKSGLHNGNGDAFRHAIWNYMMTIDIGSSFARKWSNAHEYGTTGQPAKEQRMDLFNNSVGIDLANQFPTVSQSFFISKTKQWVRSGYMLILVNNRLTTSNRDGEK